MLHPLERLLRLLVLHPEELGEDAACGDDRVCVTNGSDWQITF